MGGSLEAAWRLHTYKALSSTRRSLHTTNSAVQHIGQRLGEMMLRTTPMQPPRDVRRREPWEKWEPTIFDNISLST
eukprot:1248942-Amphidinium_carterae.1